MWPRIVAPRENALKTLIAMPFVLDGERVCVYIAAKGTKHRVIFSVDALRQEPVISHKTQVAMRRMAPKFGFAGRS